ncbi:hypothetical protein H7271_06395 [Bittarella massiliensis]|uniref:hypothetical protein n=1 Tax=Bittarella massiliensis (ex Durand et al. 2017) TaxID=1720313 RepID=UPI00163CEADD|nr:hypothetical protein [Bittarella massiliensis (ex Durand et al. 2017)]MBC2871232.1 hypothetical protein [Bittarella massiliensis (ex Durand et al. 2017)]
MMEIIPLNPELIHRANYNSFGGTRGDSSNEAYLAYGREVLGFPIADSRKEKLLAELHKRYSVVLNHEARHVSVMVAGPARYNSKQLDHSDDILRSTHEFCVWFDGVRKQVESAAKEERNEERILKDIEQRDQNGVNPMGKLAELAVVNSQKFVELFEAMQPKYRWRKNSNIYKLYLRSKAGEVEEIKKEIVFEDDNFTAYKEGDRYYIKFLLRCKRPLHVALKSRGWWWNSHKEAYSTYLDRYDHEWVQSISDRYADYL